MQGVEPATSLADVLHNEVTRVVVFEPLTVFKGVVHLGERHRARLKPAVKHVRNTTHSGFAGGVVRVGAGELIDEGTVEVSYLHPKVSLQLSLGAVHIHTRVFRVVANPHRDGGTPEAVTGNRPVAGASQPLAENTVLDVLRHPGDLLV